jgi:hypothetical protein
MFFDRPLPTAHRPLPTMIQPVLLGGVFIGVLSALPIISVANCCCLWLIGGGVLAAYLDQQGLPHRIGPGRGALVGFLAGVVGAFIWLVLALALDVVMAPLQERVIGEMLQGAQNMPPEAREWLEMVASRSASPLRYVVGLAFHLFGAVFAALGGLLAVAFSKRDLPPALGGPMAPPPLP